ncbi:MAG: ABC transporter ATP-binding protein [Clostridia bacterium]|nr:ABC transporter ATP-binding protein [Clostridia bacterium]
MSMEVKTLCFAYGEHKVLHEISFEAAYGEFISVLGPNGVGKSTLFRCMLGLLKPSSGAAYVDGMQVADMSARQLAEKIAYIPQSHSPVFNFSVYDMVLMGTTAQTGSFASPGKRQRSLANKALDRLGIFDLADRGYASLSGGERQLVLIARAIAQEAKVLVMDEPSSALDFGNRMRVMRTVQRLTRDGYAVIQSTHDPEQAYMYSDKILALQGGRVAAFGPPQETITSGLISALYGEEVEVCSMRGDSVRVCIPTTL